MIQSEAAAARSCSSWVCSSSADGRPGCQRRRIGPGLGVGGRLGRGRFLTGDRRVGLDVAWRIAGREPDERDQDRGVDQPAVRRRAGRVGDVEGGVEPAALLQPARPALGAADPALLVEPHPAAQREDDRGLLADVARARVLGQQRDEGPRTSVGDLVAGLGAVTERVDADPVDAGFVGDAEQLDRDRVAEGSALPGLEDVDGVEGAGLGHAGADVLRRVDGGGGRQGGGVGQRRLGGEGVEVDARERVVADVGDGAADLDVAAARDDRADGVDVDDERVTVRCGGRYDGRGDRWAGATAGPRTTHPPRRKVRSPARAARNEDGRDTGRL